MTSIINGQKQESGDPPKRCAAWLRGGLQFNAMQAELYSYLSNLAGLVCDAERTRMENERIATTIIAKAGTASNGISIPMVKAKPASHFLITT